MNKNRLFKCLTLVLLVNISCFAKSIDDKSNVESIKKDVYYLSDDKLEGRESGTKGARLAIDYIVSRYKEIGLEQKGSKGFLQTFKAQPKGFHGEILDVDELTVSNVIGFIDNNSKNTIVIGAHFDHIGFGGITSLEADKKEKKIHNGADDNASGVSAMLKIAELLKGKKLNNNFLFIAFTGEEKGLWGSNYFTKHPTVEFSEINFMLNLDMVGRLDKEKKIAIYGTGTSSVWDKNLDDINNGMKYVKKPSGMGPSDYTPFYLKNIPVLHFFTGQHSDYHKSTDKADKINYEGILEISNLVTNLILKTNDIGKIDFKKTKDDNARNKIKFSVTLGVMPDYMFNGKGMRIDGVIDNRPASKASILAGDIVIKIGDYDVNDMKEYMTALSKHKKNDIVDVLVNRDGKILTKKVTF